MAGMKLQCMIDEILPAGEMVDKETGELFKWAERSVCMVWFPAEDYPTKVQIRGKIGNEGEKGAIQVRFTAKKDQAFVRFGEFTSGEVVPELTPSIINKVLLQLGGRSSSSA